MSINFSTHNVDIVAAKNKIMSGDSSADWVLFGYGVGNDLKVLESGNGGLEELCQEFEGSKIQYALVRVVEPNSQLPRIVLISWCGDGVQVSRKGNFNVHVNDVANYFKGFHLQIQARHEEDVDPTVIMAKVKASSGAKYSIQQGVTNPSIAKPAMKPKPFIPTPVASTAPIPSKWVQPQPVTAVEEPPKPMFAAAPSSYQPIKTNPKPLGSNHSIHKEDKEEPKPLFASASSAYQPIKTNPKPLASAFQQSSNENVSADVSSSYQPVKTAPKPLTSAFQQSSNENVSADVSSSYQPVKTAPKPLYGHGVASKAYVAPDIPQQERKRSSGTVAPVTFTPSFGGRESTAKKENEKVELQRRQEEKLAEQRRQEATEKISEVEQLQVVRARMEEMKMKESRDREEEAQMRQQAEQREREAARRREEQQIDAEARRIQEEQQRLEQQRAEESRRAAEQAPAQGTPQFTQTAIALYDYEPVDSNEIAIMENEIIRGINQVDEGWWEGTNAAGKRGFFPSNYVELQSSGIQELQQAQQIHQVKQVQNEIQQAQPIQQAPATPAQAQMKTAIALFDYEAEEENELSFMADDIIVDIQFVSDDWWSGTVRGYNGLFPENYVQLQ